MKTIFLDFDGVLHSITSHLNSPFSKVPVLEGLVSDYSFEIVISSTWRFYYELNDLKKKLNLLGERVVGVTGEPFDGPFARYNEIVEYAGANNITDWRALDDSKQEFPENEKHLIYCEPSLGIENEQVTFLKLWLES
jgi:hypothetical protein